MATSHMRMINGMPHLDLTFIFNRGRLRRYKKIMKGLPCRKCGELIDKHSLMLFRSHYTIKETLTEAFKELHKDDIPDIFDATFDAFQTKGAAQPEGM